MQQQRRRRLCALALVPLLPLSASGGPKVAQALALFYVCVCVRVARLRDPNNAARLRLIKTYYRLDAKRGQRSKVEKSGLIFVDCGNVVVESGQSLCAINATV
jgi:hypothetical protein